MESYIVLFCPKCKEETGNGYFRELSEEHCEKWNIEVPPRICPKHHCEGEPVDIPDSEFMILYDQTEDPEFIEAMVKLRKMTLLNIEQDFCNLNDNMMQRLPVYNLAYLTAHTATAPTCLKYQIFQKQGR